MSLGTFCEKNFFRKIYYRHLHCIFDNPEEKTLWLEAKIFSLNVTEHSKSFAFLPKKTKFSSNEISGQVECSFESHAHKIFDKRPINFHSGTEIEKKVLRRKYSKWSNWHPDRKFWQPCRKISKGKRKFFHSKSKKEEKTFRVDIFLEIYHMDTENAVLTTLLTSFCNQP